MRPREVFRSMGAALSRVGSKGWALGAGTLSLNHSHAPSQFCVAGRTFLSCVHVTFFQHEIVQPDSPPPWTKPWATPTVACVVTLIDECRDATRDASCVRQACSACLTSPTTLTEETMFQPPDATFKKGELK